MKFQAHLFRDFLGVQRRKFVLWDCSYIQSPNLSAFFFSTRAITSCSSASGLDEAVTGAVDVGECPKDAALVFRKWGCSENDIDKIFSRQPSLRKANGSDIESKLIVLSEVGLGSSALVKIISCRPRFLRCGLNKYFDVRIDELRTLFGSTELFLKAIVRNPSLLIYDFEKTVKPVVSLYEQMGINRSDFISMLLSRPSLISRTNMGEEKLDCIRRMGISKESKMYKYVVTLVGVSRIETIREKVANLGKFGFSEDEVFQLFGRSPLLMTLSLDKVQRNMTFVLGTMKLPAKSILVYPFLLYSSLEDLLRPRFFLARKIQDMGLSPQIDGPKMVGTLRMSEQRFLKVYVMCHEEDIKDELLDYYRTLKRMKRLAVASRKTSHTNRFPF
uniref:Uncharacterized protein n=1 Tax=Opuntia streptacantha TaxID=393608 RepID=A0A7C9DGI9_OPUST